MGLPLRIMWQWQCVSYSILVHVHMKLVTIKGAHEKLYTCTLLFVYSLWGRECVWSINGLLDTIFWILAFFSSQDINAGVSTYISSPTPHKESNLKTSIFQGCCLMVDEGQDYNTTQMYKWLTRWTEKHWWVVVYHSQGWALKLWSQ